MSLPSWLFWLLVEGAEKSDIRNRTAVFESVGLAFGNYDKAEAKRIHRKWRDTLNRGFETSKPKKSAAEKRADWGKMAKWFS